MADKDRTKWNSKYRQKPTLLDARPPSPLVEAFHADAPGKKAIDLACGGGRHSLFLAQQGFSVDAVDISSVALTSLADRADGLDVTLIETDLDSFTPKASFYDLAVISNYLDRDLIARTADALKPQALFIIETYMEHPENEKKDSNPDFLLKEEELITFFDTQKYDILQYETFWNESYELYRMRKQGIVVRKR